MMTNTIKHDAHRLYRHSSHLPSSVSTRPLVVSHGATTRKPLFLELFWAKLLHSQENTISVTSLITSINSLAPSSTPKTFFLLIIHINQSFHQTHRINSLQFSTIS